MCSTLEQSALYKKKPHLVSGYLVHASCTLDPWRGGGKYFKGLKLLCCDRVMKMNNFYLQLIRRVDPEDCS